MELMAQCVMTSGIIGMPLWSADSLDSPLLVSYESCMMIFISEKIGFLLYYADLQTQHHLTNDCDT